MLISLPIKKTTDNYILLIFINLKSVMFNKILKLLKNIRKPVKYGRKYGKSFLGTSIGQFDNHLSKDTAKLIGQVIGSVLLPFFYPFIKPLTQGFSERSKKKARYIFYAGLAIGSSLGSVLSNSFLKNIPSDLSTGISTLIATVGVAFITIGIPFIVRKIRSTFWKEDIKDHDNLANSVLSQPDFRYRFLLGLEGGLAIGSAMGAAFGLFSPELGLLATGIGGMIGAIGGCLAAIVNPNYLKKLLSSKLTKDPSSQYEATTKGMRFGLLLGTGLGMIIGTFLLPGVDSMTGPLLGGIFGLLAGAGSVAARKLSFSQGKFSLLQHFFGQYFFGKKNLTHLAVNKKVSTATFSLVGGLLGTFLFPVIGTAGGAAIGALVGAIVAIGGGFIYSFLLSPEKKNSAKNTLPLAKDNNFPDKTSDFDKSTLKALKQEKLVFSAGSTVGAIAGSVIGSIIPGVGTVLGGLIGSFLIGTISLLYLKYKKEYTTQKPITIQDQKSLKPKQNQKDTDQNIDENNAKSYSKIYSEIKTNNREAQITIFSPTYDSKILSDLELREFKQPGLPHLFPANDKYAAKKENPFEIYNKDKIKIASTDEKFSKEFSLSTLN
jgi:uncharacterized membrane protein